MTFGFLETYRKHFSAFFSAQGPLARRLPAFFRSSADPVRKCLKLLGLPENHATEILALDCSQAMVEIAVIERARGMITVKAYETKRMSAADEGGEDILAGFIRQFCRRHGISAREIAVSISDPRQVLIKSFVLPALPEAEMQGAIEWQLKEDASFDMGAAIVDWQTLREFTDSDGSHKKEILCMAAPVITVGRYLSVAVKCGLRPITLTSSPVSCGAILQLVPDNPSVCGVLDIDYKSSSVSVYVNSKLVFVRPLQVSWEKLTHALTQVLVTENGKIALSLEEAEDLKDSVGIPLDENVFIKDNIRGSHLLGLMRPFLEILVREVMFSFDHFSAYFQKGRPELLYITGGGANMKNLEAYLQEHLGIPVSHLPLSSVIHVSGEEGGQVPCAHMNMLTGVIGAALIDPAVINVLPPEIKAQRALLFQKALVRLVMVTAAAVFLLMVVFSRFEIRDYNRRLVNARHHLQAVRYIQAMNDRIRVYETLIENLQKGRVPVDGVLKVLSAAVPDAVILEEAVFDQAGRGLTIKGIAIVPAERWSAVLTDFMGSLERSFLIEDVTLIVSRRAGAVEQFTIQCKVID